MEEGRSCENDRREQEAVGECVDGTGQTSSPNNDVSPTSHKNTKAMSGESGKEGLTRGDTDASQCELLPCAEHETPAHTAPRSSLLPALQHKDEGIVQLDHEIDNMVKLLQPAPRAEAHRKKVFQYVERLILFVAKELDMDEVYVSRFGSVPLKTYLPHGDLDLTAFAPNDKWMQRLKEKLEHEGQRESAANVVRGVHSVPHDLTRCTQADVVKVVKCQVDGISVDISANALGGLCTLCLLEKVDTMLGKQHLFKRALLLVKAWCYFESHIMSSQNGLLATYALETLVLCIVNLFHEHLTTPLDVLSKFLDYFANFDFNTNSLTIRGPVPNALIEDGGAVPELPDNASLLLSDAVLKCDSHLSTLLEGLNERRTGFQKKTVNISDPLSNKNNLGRSVSRSSSYRIGRAFRRGWSEFQELLESRDLSAFFVYTLSTLKGHRPDVGDICIPGEFNLKGPSTLSSRSTDQGRSVSSGDTNFSNISDDDLKDKEGNTVEVSTNTALNTAFNKLLTRANLRDESHGASAVEMSAEADEVGEEWEDDSEDADECLGLNTPPSASPRTHRGLDASDILTTDLEELMGDLEVVRGAIARFQQGGQRGPIGVARATAREPLLSHSAYSSTRAARMERATVRDASRPGIDPMSHSDFPALG